MRLEVALIFVLAAAGCDRSSQASSSRPLPKTVAGSGVIHGVIHFTGAVPHMQTFEPTETCCKGNPPITEQTVVVNSNGTLRNVFVYLEGAPQTDGSVASPALIDQVRCTYSPHTLGLQTGQTLAIHSNDPTMHNVHFNPSLNRARNFALTAPGAEVKTTFDHAEFIRCKCDVHPWMTAWVGVFENPFYSVTQDDGSFEIRGIPAGTYTLVAWHELYGRQEQSVSFSGDANHTAGAMEMSFTFGRQG